MVVPAAMYCGLLPGLVARFGATKEVPTRTVRRHLMRYNAGLIRRLFGDRQWDVDHFVPRRWGGQSSVGNYVLMERSCNRSHGSLITSRKIATLCRGCVASIAAVSRRETPPLNQYPLCGSCLGRLRLPALSIRVFWTR